MLVLPLLLAATAPLPMPAGLDESALDPSVDPCDDFYRFACGGWLSRTEIPADRARWSRGFITIEEQNEKLLRQTLEEIASGKSPPNTAYKQKLDDIWSTCMDEPNLEDAGKKLAADLKAFDRVKSVKDLELTVARMHAEGTQRSGPGTVVTAPLFIFRSTQDLKDASQVTGEMDQGGIGLPDRDYYVKDEPKMKEVLALYRDHVAKVFELLGETPDAASKDGDAVLDLETALATASLRREDRRDPEKVYHRLERVGLEKLAPDFPWADYFKRSGVPDVAALNVTHPPFFEALDTLVKATPAARWRPYLKWHFVLTTLPALPKRFQDEDYRFKSKALTGAKEDAPRWKKCVGFTDHALGEALAQAFVAKTFGQQEKTTTLLMVQEVEKAFGMNLDSLPWMDAPTKAKALEKVHAIFNKIGYPDHWRNYDALKTGRTSFLDNLLAANAFERARQLAKIGKPADRSEWNMTPPTVNAYYRAENNEIVFPAGILQPPFFNREAAAPVNFGAMGLVVGHEITHGFDDQGRHFDAKGNLVDWWSPTAGPAFTERADCVRKMYDDSVAVDDLHVNGKLTLGENVADLGGLKLAHA
ncbi:MAG TPA: M13 family metallopeptidase, partial [Myxococcaceae bacterium]|nr:M13 family metallopeptidase [Myxococcaceae bacterium]